MAIGRPSKYDPAFCEMIIDYFESAANAPVRDLAPITVEQAGEKGYVKSETRRICAELPTLEGFARSISVSSMTINRWRQSEPDFCEACARAKDIQFLLLVDRGLTRQYDPSAFAFVAQNITYMRAKVQLAGDKDNPISINVSDPVTELMAALGKSAVRGQTEAESRDDTEIISDETRLIT
jgi:hypothetical protein